MNYRTITHSLLMRSRKLRHMLDAGENFCLSRAVLDTFKLFGYNIEGYWRVSHMADKKGFGGYHLVKCKLSRDDVEQVSKLLKDTDEWKLECLFDILEQGYKISITPSESSNSVSVSASGKEWHPTNPQKVLTSWADLPTDALVALWYKIFRVYDGGVWTDKESDNRFG